MLELRQTCAIIASEVTKNGATRVRNYLGSGYAWGSLGRVSHLAVQKSAERPAVHSWPALHGNSSPRGVA